ncbi:MAG: family 16 glycosylhydrolase [Candidatus Margulisbacteria bacterium]|nr:family 16 glycosylhydrolase [Candidatus Margulisiibacteriota bacterium]
MAETSLDPISYPAAATAPTPKTSKKKQALITWQPTINNELNGDERGWERRTGSNPAPFAAAFRPENITFSDGIMRLLLNNNGCPVRCDGRQYVAGEYRSTEEPYGYGYYEARLKAPKITGAMSASFFTYTGEYGKKNHHEIDFEIFGRDTKVVWLNYFVEGRGTENQQHQQSINLWFDASEDFHNYGFKWTETELAWYVDGRMVQRVTEDPNTPEREIPFAPSKIMVNLWPGNNSPKMIGSLGQYVGQSGAAEYDWIRYSTLADAAAATSGQPASTIVAPLSATVAPPAVEMVEVELPPPLSEGELAALRIAAAALGTPEPATTITTHKLVTLGLASTNFYGFNRGTVKKNNGTYVFSAAGGQNPGFGIFVNNLVLQGQKKLTFKLAGEIKGKGNLVVQLYGNDQFKPLAIRENLVPDGEISVNLGANVERVKKIQFILRDNNGNCELRISDLRFE